jgi:hypothetical protein
LSRLWINIATWLTWHRKAGPDIRAGPVSQAQAADSVPGVVRRARQPGSES